MSWTTDKSLVPAARTGSLNQGMKLDSVKDPVKMHVTQEGLAT